MAQVSTKCRPNFRPQDNRISEYINILDLELNKEADRRKSFIDNDWSNKYVDYEELALLGFFFYKWPDVVKCYFCRQSLNNFEPNDDVLTEHLKFSPNCPLLIRRKTNNEPIDLEKLNKALPPVSYDEYGTGSCSSKVEEKLAYPQYRNASERIRTFKMWPVGIKQKPVDLCDAGFFYSGSSDCVICFSCGVRVLQWEAKDNPWVEHNKLRVRDCKYLELNSEKLANNQKKFEEEEKARIASEEVNVPGRSSEHENSVKEKEINEESLCKICYENKSSIVFLPCKHVAVCGQCVYEINGKCPICRADIIESIKLYYA